LPGDKKKNLELDEAEAKEIAYHYLRTHFAEKLRPVKLTRESANGHGEPVLDNRIGRKELPEIRVPP